jgi:hypothetical protein
MKTRKKNSKKINSEAYDMVESEKVFHPKVSMIKPNSLVSGPWEKDGKLYWACEVNPEYEKRRYEFDKRQRRKSKIG